MSGGGWEGKHLKQVLNKKSKYIFLKNGTWPACGGEKKAGINLTPTWLGQLLFFVYYEP